MILLETINDDGTIQSAHVMPAAEAYEVIRDITRKFVWHRL